MTPEFDKTLVRRYPRRSSPQRHLTVQQSCMAWGFACGDGWFRIIFANDRLLVAVDGGGDRALGAVAVGQAI